MGNHALAHHVARNFDMRVSQVEKAIQKNHSFVWIEYGRTFRDATMAEAFAMRIEQPKTEPRGLCYFVEGKDGELIEKPYFAELPDCVYRPAEKDQAGNRAELRTMREANRFAAAVTFA